MQSVIDGIQYTWEWAYPKMNPPMLATPAMRKEKPLSFSPRICMLAELCEMGDGRWGMGDRQGGQERGEGRRRRKGSLSSYFVDLPRIYINKFLIVIILINALSCPLCSLSLFSSLFLFPQRHSSKRNPLSPLSSRIGSCKVSSF